MKKNLTLVLIIIIINTISLFAQVQIKFPKNQEPLELKNQIASTTTSLIENGKIIHTKSSNPNEDKDVIVEFSQEPVKTFKGQTNFNFSNLNRSLELVQLQQKRFLNDLERIINDEELIKIHGIRPVYTIKFRYKIALNGISLRTKPWVIDEIKKLDYIKSVHDVVEVKTNDDASNKVIRADSVWANYGVKGKGILIAIIDTGIDSNHVSLNNGKVVGGYSFVSNSPNFFDDHGHGTHCAGIAAGNGNGLTGVAPEASLLGVKVLNAQSSGSSDAIIAGIEYSIDPDGDPNTDDGADVINLSLGGSGYPEDPQCVAVNNAVENGVVCVVSAGNAGKSIYTLFSPGIAKDALTVAATDNNDQVANFSSRGPVVGSDIIKPDISAPGVDIYSAAPYNQFATKSGTSMSAPHVAGAAALLRQINPTWTPQEIKSALMGTSIDVGATIWEQGGGRMDIFSAAKSKSIIMPSSINFGNIELSDSSWTKSDTLTLYNKSLNSQTYNLFLDYDFPDGFTYEIEPQNVSINAGSSAKAILKVYVNDINFPIPDINPPTYKGKLIAKSENDEIKTDFIFSKARFLNIDVFETAEWIILTDRNMNVEYAKYSGKKNVSIPIPLGTYDVFVSVYDFNDTADPQSIIPVLPYYFFVKDSIVVDRDTNYYVNINKDDFKNKITFNYLNKNENPTNYLNYGSWYFKFTSNRMLLLNGGIVVNEFYVNDISAQFELGFATICYIKSDLDYYDKFMLMYASKNGINQSETYNISVNNSFKINYQYDDFNSLNRKISTEGFDMMPAFNTYLQYTEQDLSEMFLFEKYSINFNLRNDNPNIKQKYYNFINADNFTHTSQYHEDYGTKSVQLSPIINIKDNKLNYLTHDKLDTIKRFDYGSHFVNIDSYQFFTGDIMLRNDNISGIKITRPTSVEPYNKPGIFNNSYGFSLQKSTNLKIINQDLVVVDTLLNNFIKNANYNAFDNEIFYENFNLPAGFNKVEIKYDSLLFYDKLGFVKVSCGFNSETSNKDFPECKLLFISNNDVLKEIYKPDDTISIKCKLNNLEESDTLKFYYKELESSEWIQLDYNYSDGFYIAKIDSTELFNYYSVKISIARSDDEYLTQELEPAFYTGLTKPKLISPEIDSKKQPLFEFSWEAVPFAQKYLIQISEDIQFNALVFNDTINTAFFSLPDSLNYWSTYYWRVKAITNSISSRWSETWRFYTITDPKTPHFNFFGFGWNYYGQVGDSTIVDILTPKQISFTDEWNLISAGYFHNHAIKPDGTLWGWGANYNKRLGFNNKVSQYNYPVQVGKEFDWKKIACGFWHSVGIKNNGQLWAWGRNSRGQIGYGSINEEISPVQIGIDTNWKYISCSQDQTFAIKSDGSLWAWGANDYGQLGDGSTIDKTSPTRIGGDNDWLQVVGAPLYTIGIKTDGTLWGWGDNTIGQFPYDSIIVNKPVKIGIDTNWKYIACGYAHTICLKTDGTIWGFGRNYIGQIGDSTYLDRYSPIQIGQDTNWVHIACGYNHSKAIKFDGSLWSWGANNNGQLGDGTTTNKNYPVKIDTTVKWRYITCGSEHSLGLIDIVPILETPAKDSINIQTNLTFKWKEFPNATTYKFQLSKNLNFETLIIDESGISENEFNVPELEYNTKYFWRVKANVDTVESDWSYVWGFTTKPNEMLFYYKQGWNLVSSYITPFSPDSLQYITADLNPNLVIMKRADGKIFMPSGLNQIGIWDVKFGYQSYLTKADTLVIIGTAVVPENTPVYLNNGWSIIPYLRNSAMSIVTALASITDAGRLVIVKRADGKIYIPGSINQIGNQLPGEGYQAYLNAKDTLIYPPNAIGRTSSTNQIDDFEARIIKTDYENTSNNASLILNIDLPDNTEIAVMNNDNKIVGAGRVVNSKTAIVIWGDDESTVAIDGSIENYELRIMNYDSEKNKYYEINNLDLTDIISGTKFNKLTYNKDAVLIGKALTQPITLKVNPNPFSKNTEVVYTLADDCEIELSLYNLVGMKVLDIANGKQNEGIYKLTINSDNLSSGTYNLILKCCGKSEVEKVVVVK